MDDPLRILRAIRFASRLEFGLHGDIIEAATKPHVRSALGTKISRERIGKELDGMLSGNSHDFTSNSAFTLPPPMMKMRPCMTHPSRLHRWPTSTGPHPELAFYYINDLHLHDIVWALPPPPKGKL